MTDFNNAVRMVGITVAVFVFGMCVVLAIVSNLHGPK